MVLDFTAEDTKPKCLLSSHLPVGIWGACFDQGQPHQGVGEAPHALREGGLVTRLSGEGCSVIDYGDVRVARGHDQTPANRQKEVAKFGLIAHNMVKKMVGQGEIAVTLGGDHSIALGTVAGHLSHDPDCVVVWVDAHADINTLSSSETGNMHGMPLSFNIKELQEEFPHPHIMSWLTPQLAPSQLVYVGLRDVDEAEKKILEDLNIKAFYMTDVDSRGIVQVVEDALKTVDPDGIRNIHLSFDIDALDPLDAPATGTAVRGGLTLDEGLTLCDLVYSTGRLKAVDMVEVNPSLASNKADAEKTINAANKILMTALGFGKSDSMDGSYSYVSTLEQKVKKRSSPSRI